MHVTPNIPAATCPGSASCEIGFISRTLQDTPQPCFTCQDCKTLSSRIEHEECTCAAMGYPITQNQCTGSTPFCKSPLNAFGEVCCREGCSG